VQRHDPQVSLSDVRGILSNEAIRRLSPLSREDGNCAKLTVPGCSTGR
jgi:hypothetical protein